MKLLIMVVSIFFDVLFLNVFRFTGHNISYLYPMFTISSIVYVSNYYSFRNRKNFYILVLLVSIIYDTFCVNNLLIVVLIFQIIAFINIFFRKRFSSNLFNNLVFLIFSILIYDLSFHLLLVLVKYQNLDLYRVIYKFTHSLLLNVIYIITMFLVLKPKSA